MTTATLTLSDFLLARISEDEAVARAATRESSYDWSDNAFTEAVELAEGEGAVKEATTHIARWDPARVLAKCAADRRIVQLWRDDSGDSLWGEDVLRLLAGPYADHPDYRAEWRP